MNALKMMGEENYEQAIQELQQIIQDSPDFTAAHRKLAESYIFTNELGEAQIYFEELLKENVDNPVIHYCLARVDFAKKDYDGAIEELEKVIEIDPGFVDAYGYPGGLAEVYNAKDDLDSAVPFFEKLIQEYPKNACAHYGLGRVHLRRYEWETALGLLSRAIYLDPELTLAYHSMIFIYWSTTRYDKTIQTSEELLEVSERINDLEMLSYSTMMIGNTYFVKGDYLNALHYLNEALGRAKDIGAKRREGNCLNNLAYVYAMSGNFKKALEYFTSALDLSRKTGNLKTEGITLSNIGNVYKDQGSYDEALIYYQEALENSRENRLKHEESLALLNMADMFQLDGKYNKALVYQNNALGIAKEIDDKYLEGFILKSLGNLHIDLGEYPKAADYLADALEIGISTQDAQVIWESQAGLGSCYAKQGNLQEAITHYANAISLYDSVRQNLDIESLGNNFLEDKYEAYPSIVELLAENGKVQDAFTYANKYKAKALLDILFQGQNFLSELLSDTIRTQLNEITSDLETAHHELSIELAQDEGDKNRILSLDQQITDLELRKSVIIEGLKKQHSQYYHLTSHEILEVEDIQNRILAEGQALVQYIVGPEKTSIFVVTTDSLIYSQASMSRDSIHAILADLSPIFDFQASAEGKARPQILNPQLLDFTIAPAHRLYENLVRPIEAWLQGASELIVVPDDILFYLPFEMLVFDAAAAETQYDFENARFLLEKYDISYVSSIDLLDPDMQRMRSPSKGILALGNPDFGSDADAAERMQVLTSELPTAQGTVRGDRLANLPNSESEVKAIGKVLGGSKNNILIGKEATEENLKANAEEYGILHLATHFLINDGQPLYSKIVLTQDDKAKEDGYLQTYEVFNMNLNADLVVLSACNTGLGRIRRGEGVIGISRAFLYAGVPSMMASLWSVDDQSTSIIMKNFYEHLQAGSNKRQALRLAKIDYLTSSEGVKKDPFYWAPFVLIGDWSSVNLPSRSPVSLGMIMILALALLIVITVTLLTRSRMRLSH
jgi:CHAT domain-containing protein/Tfp pilus assembly protein PilF